MVRAWTGERRSFAFWAMCVVTLNARMSPMNEAASSPVAVRVRRRTPANSARSLFCHYALGGTGAFVTSRRREPVSVLHQRVADELTLASFAGPFLQSCASGSVLETRVGLLRVSPRPPGGGSSEPSSAPKLFLAPHSGTCVASTEKCSSDRRPRTSLWFKSST
jgi:hypothetical protein